MTPAEKKRLTWVLLAIFFFFGNLFVGVVLVLNILESKKPIPPATMTSPPTVTTQQSVTQP